jgi:AraC-like DNA-binding protein
MNDYEMKQINEISHTLIEGDNVGGVFPVENHSLIYLFSGSLRLEQKGKIDKVVIIRAGECVFVRKDLSVGIVKNVDKSTHRFESVTMSFSRSFLQGVYRSLSGDVVGAHVQRSRKAFLKMPVTDELKSLFENALEMLKTSSSLDRAWVNKELNEGLTCVLKADRSVYASIFDFASPWKIDLLEFMNENYMYRLSLKELANYTGRSLSTFKRDFKKLTDQTPERWIIDKRLDEAQRLLAHGCRRVSEVMAKVGITNQSYFSRAYKDKFGYTPKHTPQERD